jgi:hypothetical protein
MDDLEPRMDERAAPARDEQDVLIQTERLVSQLADLYNENTLLRERVRVLENEMRRTSQHA